MLARRQRSPAGAGAAARASVVITLDVTVASHVAASNNIFALLLNTHA